MTETTPRAVAETKHRNGDDGSTSGLSHIQAHGDTSRHGYQPAVYRGPGEDLYGDGSHPRDDRP